MTTLRIVGNTQTLSFGAFLAGAAAARHLHEGKPLPGDRVTKQVHRICRTTIGPEAHTLRREYVCGIDLTTQRLFR